MQLSILIVKLKELMKTRRLDSMKPEKTSCLIILLIAFTASQAVAFLGFETWKLAGGLMKTNSSAAKSLAEDLGGDPKDATSLIVSIQTRNDYGNQTGKIKIRYGVLISTLHEWNYWETPDSLDHLYDRLIGYGYGAYRLGFVPEIYSESGNFEFSFGTGIGIGYSKHFFDDNTGENDNEDVFEGFIRPQLSIGYGKRLKAEFTLGYHQPFLGTFGRYWYKDSSWEPVYYGFSPSELAGGFFQLGIVFMD